RVRRLGGHGGGDQDGPPVPPADRQPAQVQGHLPLPVMAWLPPLAPPRPRALFGKPSPSCEITCAPLVGDVIEMEDPETVAAVIVEPIGHTGGIIDPPDEYLPLVREVCAQDNVLRS